MKRLPGSIPRSRLWSLILKELRHIKRDHHLIVMLIVPPTVQLVIFGLALNPQVTGLRLGVVDESRSAISREVVSAFTESRSFELTGQFASPDEMSRELSAGDLDAGLIIPAISRASECVERQRRFNCCWMRSTQTTRASPRVMPSVLSAR